MEAPASFYRQAENDDPELELLKLPTRDMHERWKPQCRGRSHYAGF